MSFSFQSLYQPDGYSCGPTCLAMVIDAVLQSSSSCRKLSISQLGALMGCNEQHGTTDIEMTRGLEAFNLSFERHLHGAHEASLQADVFSALSRGQCVLLRTYLHGIKHWVLATGEPTPHQDSDDFYFELLDPAQGPRKALWSEIAPSLLARGGDVWPIDLQTSQTQILNIAVQPLSSYSNDAYQTQLVFETALQAVSLSLAHRMHHDSSNLKQGHETHPAPSSFEKLSFSSAVRSRAKGIQNHLRSYDWDYDHVLILTANEQIIGGYFTLAQTLEEHFESPDAQVDIHNPEVQEVLKSFPPHEKGLFGVALGIHPEWQGRGYGHVLKSGTSACLHADYSFGYQLKSLNNHDEWAKTRPHFIDLGSMWFSCGRLPFFEPLRNPSFKPSL